MCAVLKEGVRYVEGPGETHSLEKLASSEAFKVSKGSHGEARYIKVPVRRGKKWIGCRACRNALTRRLHAENHSLRRGIYVGTHRCVSWSCRNSFQFYVQP